MSASIGLLTRFLADAVARAPESLAVVDQDHALSYRDLAAAATRLAAELACRGVGRGDRVILMQPNSAAFCVAWWGILAAGAVAVPLNPETLPARLAFILGNCTPRAIIADSALGETVAQAQAEAGQALPVLEADRLAAPFPGDEAPATLAQPPVLDLDLAAIIYTSGSTGAPKGVMLTHLNMTAAARSVAQYLGYQPEDHIFCAIPMSFDYGLHQVNMAALTGASVRAEPGFTQPFFALKHLQDSGATVLPLVPTMVPMIAPLADRFDLSRVRLVSSTAAALHAELIDTICAVLPGARVFSMYGLTECHRCTYLPPAELQRRKTSVGIAIPNTELWVIDDAGQAHRHSATGELVIRGATVMKGYWQNPEATARRLKPGPLPGEMVLHTGDICRLDAEGFLYFVARTDDILKIGGEKVAPSEVEAVLSAHDLVSEVCVLGAAHPVHGQVCVAHVTGTATPKALLDWCRSRLAPASVPFRVMIWDAMPRTQNGKIDRAALAARFEAPRPPVAALQPAE